jgi:uncharacterized protein (DUF1800 family)
MGPKQGSIAALASDPRGALLAELARPGAGRIANAELRSSGEAARAFHADLERRRVDRRSAQDERQRLQQQPSNKSAAPAPPGEPGMTDNMEPQPGSRPAPPRMVLNLAQQIYYDEATARMNAALDAEAGFVERLVWFWSNHFCIKAQQRLRAIAGAYEREAIRAHVTGRFEDMLLAAESHPAMLFYLDNTRSIGPNSAVGLNRGRGLNENLAREILELHTLGVRANYTQNDVTSFAKVLTGWTVHPVQRDPQLGGEFRFLPQIHEPGEQTVVGKRYADTGVEQGRAVLRDLARHPATANHIATKLATHFVGDNSPPPLVERIALAFRESGGDLTRTAVALIESPEAWTPERIRLKRPSEWFMGALRATGIRPPDVRIVLQAQAMLGEPLWLPPSPKGYPDDNAPWIGGLTQRLELAKHLSGRVQMLVDPAALLEQALGPLASDDTRRTVLRAESRRQAVALLLMAPEFLRR